MDFTIKTGVKVYKLRDENKTVFAEFSLNPGDVGVARRYTEAVAEIKKYTIPNTEDSKNDVLEAERYLTGRFSYILGYDVEKDLFGRYSPLATFPDGFFFQLLLPLIGREIGAEVKERSKKIEKQIAKTMKALDE